jgi:SagB-type dehydrogenase family enzyme
MDETSRSFLTYTRYPSQTKTDQMKGIAPPVLEKPPESGAVSITLKDPEKITVPPLDMRTAIEERRSVRNYLPDPITLNELTYLLWCTQGISVSMEPYYTLRNSPSAGGRHAFETYLLCNNIKDLPGGIWRYLSFSNTLSSVRAAPDITQKTHDAFLGQHFIGTAAVVFIWTCVIYRMAWRYGDRSYRLVFLDAGHVCQNLYLAAEQIKAGVCAVGAFDDHKIAEILRLNEDEEFVIYAAAVGKRRDENF